METLSNILAVIFFLSPIWLIIALIKPSLFKLKSRWHLALIYPAFVVVIMLGFGFTVPDKTPEQIAAEKAQIEQQEKELAEKERLAKIEPARIGEENIIRELRSATYQDYYAKTRDERISFIKSVIKYAKQISEGTELSYIVEVQEKYKSFNQTDLIRFYNTINKKLMILSSNDLIKVIQYASLEFLDGSEPEKRNFDAVFDNQTLIVYQMKKYIKSQLHDPSSFEFVRVYKELEDDVFIFTMIYRGRNAYNAIVTEQFPVNVSIATGEIIWLWKPIQNICNLVSKNNKRT